MEYRFIIRNDKPMYSKTDDNALKHIQQLLEQGHRLTLTLLDVDLTPAGFVKGQFVSVVDHRYMSPNVS